MKYIFDNISIGEIVALILTTE